MNQISVRQLHEMRQRGDSIYLVDVRQPWEHELARLPDDILVPLDQLADRSDEITPPAGALVVTYCHHGIRSLNAAAILQQLGHVNVASLAGGIDAWSQLVDPSVARY
ncbi:MAG TPA: rhodanese-like domain-containing protein [Polyangia bacterium]